MDPSSSRTPAPSSASTSTAGEPATTRAAPVIGALSAASHRMALRLAGARNELPPRPSPLTFKADAWASVLEGLGLSDRYADVIRGLREGVDLEILRITSTAIAINAPSANIHRSALREVILKERQRGAYIGPFQNAGDVQGVLHNSFQSMPLSLIPKPPDKFRLIQNFSANVGGSKATNDLIPRSWATTCSTFRQIVGNILSLPADSEACTRVNAQRSQLSESLAPQPFLRRGDKWWVDGEGRRYDESYEDPLRASTKLSRRDGWHYGDEEIKILADDLSLPLHKPTPWSSIFTYAGYVFDIRERRAGLPASKAAKYRADLDIWLSSPTHRLEDAQRLLGRLLHASPVVLDSARHLTRLIGFVNVGVRSNAHAGAERHGGSPLDEDVRWWRERLNGEEVWRSIAQYA
ncbi:hypothetical protein CF335_g8638, partial [Tilletia laevis]